MDLESLIMDGVLKLEGLLGKRLELHLDILINVASGFL
jgi:hypothetical protein